MRGLQRGKGCRLIARRFLIEIRAGAVELFDKINVAQDVGLLGCNLCHGGKIRLSHCQAVSAKIVVHAVLEILRAKIYLIIAAGLGAVQIVYAADPVVVACALVVRELIPFQPAEDIYLAAVLNLELCNGRLILRGAPRAHAVFPVAGSMAVPREAQRCQPLRAGRRGHLLQCVFAVAEGRVTVYAGFHEVRHG